MERQLPEKKFRKLAVPQEVALFGKLCKFVIFFSAPVLWQLSPRVGHPRQRLKRRLFENGVNNILLATYLSINTSYS